MNLNVIWSTILPVVLCKLETQTVTLREERRLRESENRVLRKVFRPRWYELTVEWGEIA